MVLEGSRVTGTATRYVWPSELVIGMVTVVALGEKVDSVTIAVTYDVSTVTGDGLTGPCLGATGVGVELIVKADAGIGTPARSQASSRGERRRFVSRDSSQLDLIHETTLVRKAPSQARHMPVSKRSQ